MALPVKTIQIPYAQEYLVKNLEDAVVAILSQQGEKLQPNSILLIPINLASGETSLIVAVDRIPSSDA